MNVRHFFVWRQNKSVNHRVELVVESLTTKLTFSDANETSRSQVKVKFAAFAELHKHE